MIASDSSDSPQESSISPTDEPSGSSESPLVSGGCLNDEGKREVARWINEGLSLSDVQKRLASEHGLTLTYMETRFLVDDLELALQDPEPEPEPEPESEPSAAEGQEPAVDAPGNEDEGMPGDQAEGTGVSVEVDKIMRPGALASGAVTFPDGVTMQWQLDQFGRLAITPKEGYQPSEENLMAFQQQLQGELRKAGF